MNKTITVRTELHNGEILEGSRGDFYAQKNKMKKEKGCTCENHDPKLPHEYTCELNLCQVEKKFKNTKHTPTDTQMENLAVLDLLEMEGYSDAIIDRVERAVNSHEALLEAARQLIDEARKTDIITGYEGFIKLKKAIAQAEGK